jgi:hypothetical protein
MTPRFHWLFSRHPPLSADLSGRSQRSRPGRVKLLVQSRRTHPWWHLGSWLLVGSTATLAGFVIWSGVRLIIDPYNTNWLKVVFPALNPVDASAILTLEEIQTQLQRRNLIAGTPILWYVSKQATHSTPDWIFPIQATRPHCQRSCTSITELHIYRPLPGGEAPQRYQRLHQVQIKGPQESFITTPLVGTASAVASVDQVAPLTRLKLFKTPLDEAPWLLVEGQKIFGNTEIRYGQVLHYDPKTAAIHTLATWTSPAGKSPIFQIREGSPRAELLIDQTVGLEPQLQIYEVMDTHPPQLTEISLLRSVYAQPLSSSLYQKALRLAQNGVWSHAQQMMQSARQALGTDWSPEAEAQLRVITAHASITQAQARRTWSSKSQQVQAFLIDGQWETALKTLENNPGLYDTLSPLLKKNFERLWKRLQTHLQIHPQDPAAQIWGALVVAARQTPSEGKTWLTQQSQDKSLVARFETALAPPSVVPLVPPPVATTASPQATAVGTSRPEAPTTPRYQRLLGSAIPLDSPGSNWDFTPERLPTLTAQQSWYQVTVLNLYVNHRWIPVSQAEFTGANPTPDNLWPGLGLHTNPSLHLIGWDASGQATPANLQIVGLRRQNHRLELLGIGPAPSGGEHDSAIAVTASALQWLSTTAGIPLNVLLQTEPRWNQRLPRQLESLLGLAPTAGPNPTLTASYPYWQTYYLDITGDGQAELFLTLNPADLPNPLSQSLSLPPHTAPRTLIVSTTGTVLYNDLSSSQRLMAIAPGAPTLATALLIAQGAQYRLTYLDP